MADGPLVEAIAAAVLDNTTLTFAPGPPGTPLPTDLVIVVRHERDGRSYAHTHDVSLSALSLSPDAGTELAGAVNAAMEPLISAVLSGDTAELTPSTGPTAPR